MKIIVSGYVGKRITGIGGNLINLLNRINREDMKFVVYTNFDMVEDLRFDNPNVIVKTYKISRENSLGNLLWTTFILPIMAVKEKADITLITNFTFLLIPIRPTVIFIHDMIEFRIPDKQSKLRVFYRTKLAVPISARNAARIVTVSQNSKKDIQELLNIDCKKIDYVSNGIDRNKFYKLDEKKALEVLSKKGWIPPFILFVGTIDHPGRNLINLIKAFETLEDSKKYDGKLILVGRKGKGADIVEDYIYRSKYRDNIIITGYISDDELKALYSLCSVFCYISLYEGFGMPPLEALASGARVVVSNTSSLPEAVGNVGIKVDPLDVNDITDAIYKVLITHVDDNYQKQVEEHLSRYSWKNGANQLADVLIKVYKNI